MAKALQEVHASLLNMTLAVKRLRGSLDISGTAVRAASAAPFRAPQSSHPHGPAASPVACDSEDAPKDIWWVLVCGDPLDPYSLERRDKARERLREQCASHGLNLREHVWVWDSTGVAQVVAGEFASRDDAEDFARTLREKGLKVRVRVEMR